VSPDIAVVSEGRLATYAHGSVALEKFSTRAGSRAETPGSRGWCSPARLARGYGMEAIAILPANGHATALARPVTWPTFCGQARRRADRPVEEQGANEDRARGEATQQVLFGRYAWFEADVLDPAGDGAMTPMPARTPPSSPGRRQRRWTLRPVVPWPASSRVIAGSIRGRLITGAPGPAWGSATSHAGVDDSRLDLHFQAHTYRPARGASGKGAEQSADGRAVGRPLMRCRNLGAHGRGCGQDG
jgi:hypothetical protein